MKRHPATLKDIAETVGVSITTVASVLNASRNNHTRVSQETRHRIQEAARRLNYRRNRAAARLGGGRTRILGILVDNLANGLNMPIATGFEKEANLRGYQCFVGSTHYDNWRKQDYIHNFLEHGVDGIFMTVDWADPQQNSTARILESKTALVYSDFNWEAQTAPLVCGDHFAGAQVLLRHLIEVGHRRFLYLVPEWLLTFFAFRERVRGMRELLEQEGYSPAVLTVSPVPFGDKDRYARAVIRELHGPTPPTVVMAANDGIAFELVMGLREHGVRVPQDLALTGYDDVFAPLLQAWMPGTWQQFPWLTPLTTVRQPHDQIGRTAAEELIKQIEEAIAPAEHATRRLLPVELVIRESSRLPAAEAASGDAANPKKKGGAPKLAGTNWP